MGDVGKIILLLGFQFQFSSSSSKEKTSSIDRLLNTGFCETLFSVYTYVYI